MPSVRIGPRALLRDGQLLEVQANSRTLAVCAVDGEVHALDGICPHAGGRLGHGALHGHTIVCPWHGWEFDCRTGEGSPAGEIAVHEAHVTGEDIVVEFRA